MLNLVSVRALMFAVTVSCVVLILFYEIGVVNFVFLQNPDSLKKELRNLSGRDLRKYLVRKGGASELLFQSYVDTDNKYTGRQPWQFCSSREECYKKLLHDSDPAEFFFTYEQSRRFEVRKRKACSKLAVFRPRSPLASVAAGMYYSSDFPKKRRVALDKEILTLRLEHKIQDLLNKENPPLDCRPEASSIGPSVIFWLLLPIFVMAMVPVAVAVIFTFMLRRSEAEKVSREIVRHMDQLTAAEYDQSSLKKYNGCSI